MAEKFGRKFRSDKAPFKFGADFEVEGYLHNRGDSFVKRFDANSYLYITKAIDYFNLLNGHSLGSIFKGLKAKVLVIAFKSDWLYPAYQSQEIVKACKLCRRRCKLLRNKHHLWTRLVPGGDGAGRPTYRQLPQRREQRQRRQHKQNGKQS